MPTHGSVCILEMLQADGSQFRAAHGRASGVELTTECIEVPGGKGQPLGPAAKKNQKTQQQQKSASFTSNTSEGCHCSPLAPTIQTEPRAAVPGRNEVVPG